MAVKQLQDVYSFRKTGLTCHKWKADDPDKGVGETDDPNEADDPNEGVGKANNPNETDDPDEGVGETDDPDKGVGKADNPNEADDPDEGVGEADDLMWPCLVSTFAYIQKYLAPHAWC